MGGRKRRSEALFERWIKTLRKSCSDIYSFADVRNAMLLLLLLMMMIIMHWRQTTIDKATTAEAGSDGPQTGDAAISGRKGPA